MFFGNKEINNIKEFFEYLETLKVTLFQNFRQEIRLDSAAGAFPTYPPIRQAYSEQTDYSRYIDYKDQFVNAHSPNADWRERLVSFIKQLGVIDSNKETSVSHITAGFGTGYLFDKSVRIIVKNSGDVIIVPVPTYGFCIPAIEAAKGTAVFLPLKEENQYQLTAEELEDKIQEINHNLFAEYYEEYSARFRIFLAKVPKKYLESNPFTPSNNDLLDFANSQSLIKHLKNLVKTNPKDHTELVGLLKRAPTMPRVRGLYFINPNNPLGTIYNQQSVNKLNQVLQKYHLIVLEDLVHMEIKPSPVCDKPATTVQGFFGHSSTSKMKQITLLSPSKALSAAECRIGFSYASKAKWAERIQDFIFNDGLFLSTAQQQALKNAFTITPERIQYTESNNKEYFFRREMLRYLILGKEAQVDPAIQCRITAFFTKHQLDLDLFKEGIPGLKLFNPEQEGGFFFVIDMSALLNRYFLEFQLKTAEDFYHLFKLANVVTIHGGQMYCDKPILRLSFSLDPLLVVEGMKRIIIITKQLKTVPTTCSSIEEIEHLAAPPPAAVSP